MNRRAIKTPQKGFQDTFIREYDAVCHTFSVCQAITIVLKTSIFKMPLFKIIYVEVMKLRPISYSNVLTNQLWLPLFSILLISLAVRLHHALSLRFTSIFPASWQSLKASESYTKKAFDRNNEVIIIIITIIILQNIFVYCMLWFFSYSLCNHNSNNN